jgi:hypothetical protein
LTLGLCFLIRRNACSTNSRDEISPARIARTAWEAVPKLGLKRGSDAAACGSLLMSGAASVEPTASFGNDLRPSPAHMWQSFLAHGRGSVPVYSNQLPLRGKLGGSGSRTR